MKLNYFATLFIVIIASHLLLEAECKKQKEGKKEREKDTSRGNGKQKEVDVKNKSKSGSKSSEGKEQNSQGSKSALQGNFSTKDKTQCTWVVTANDPVSLRVECQQASNDIWCEFTGRPSFCSNFQKRQAHYWKQIVRALKKQNNICKEPSAVLKTKMCKKGPVEAHLKLTNSFLHVSKPLESDVKQDAELPSAVDNTNVINNNCTDDSDGNENYKKLAEEYCGDRWGSMCEFILSMIKSKSC